ncbi:MAG: dGTPase [Verrucomicrobiales bacterium]|jgi:dGTPase
MGNRFYNSFDLESLEPEPAGGDDYRTVFQRNRDRIIYTSAFRRLQNKTQVFLSGDYDFYRTRLTHSIEVSQIGRSICAYLQSTSPLLSDDFFVDSDVVEASCLSHDIGHPPFGHTGERALNRLMQPYGGFEGNAQTLRMLTETIFSNSGRGMNPCRAFLDGVLKYKTLHSELNDPENHFLYDPQDRFIDFVYGEQAFPVELTPGKTRDAFRSIECEIMDWADDTAYSLNDLMDGINAGFITLEKLERWATSESLEGTQAHHVEELMRAIRDARVEGRLGRKVGAFIAACDLKEDVNFLSATTNRHRYRLKVTAEARAEAEVYKRISFHLVFRSQELHQLDHKADYVLTRLFRVLEKRYVVGEGKLRLLPEMQEQAILRAPEPEQRARLVCDAIAAMTDGFATRTYKRLFDADFGSIADLV